MSAIRKLFCCCMGGGDVTQLRALSKPSLKVNKPDPKDKYVNPDWKNFGDRGIPDGNTSPEYLAPSENAVDLDSGVTESVAPFPPEPEQQNDLSASMNNKTNDTSAEVKAALVNTTEESPGTVVKSESDGDPSIVYLNVADNEPSADEQDEWSIITSSMTTPGPQVEVHPEQEAAAEESVAENVSEEKPVVYLNMQRSVDMSEPPEPVEISEKRQSTTFTITMKTPTSPAVSSPGSATDADEENKFFRNSFRGSKSGRSLYQITHKRASNGSMGAGMPENQNDEKILLVEAKLPASTDSSSSSSTSSSNEDN